MSTISLPELLLDTHVWYEYCSGQTGRLSDQVVKAIDSSTARLSCFVSVVSFLEIGLLASRGRLELGMPLAQWTAEAVRRSGVRVLPVDGESVLLSVSLPGEPHRDPWDRLLIATAQQAGLRLVTRDREIARYARGNGVRLLDATSGRQVNEPVSRPAARRRG